MSDWNTIETAPEGQRDGAERNPDGVNHDFARRWRMRMRFTGKVNGLEPLSKFTVLRFFDGRSKGYKAGYTRHNYQVTERGEDFVLADDAIIRMDEVDVPIFDGIDIGNETIIAPSALTEQNTGSVT